MKNFANHHARLRLSNRLMYEDAAIAINHAEIDRVSVHVGHTAPRFMRLWESLGRGLIQMAHFGSFTLAAARPSGS